VTRSCAWCSGPIPPGARRDSVTCSKPCRQARHRAARYASRGPSASSRDGSRAGRDTSPAGGPRRLAYADPPYPGKAGYYREHPDFAGEVDHEELLRRLAGFDGWALSTSAEALPGVLALAVAQDLPVRVASWVRGERPVPSRYPLNAWEPVVYVPTPAADLSRVDGVRRLDVLTHGVSPLMTLPSRVIGTKPPAFCSWVFDLLGATPADELTDLFPGSGVVGICWDLFRGPREEPPPALFDVG
jgi:hypothetical protein